MRLIDLTGEKRGRLTVVSLAGKNPVRWNVMCDCGSPIKVVTSSNLSTTKSCGCLQVEATSAKNTRHGQRSIKPTKTYKIWSSMVDRTKSSVLNYGGRGITVSDSWKVFENFFRDIGEIPEGFSLERKDVNGNYCKENCELIPLGDQAKNRRSTVMIETIGGVRQSLIALCADKGLDRRKTYDAYCSLMRHKKMTKNEAMSTLLGYSVIVSDQRV